MLNKSMDLIQAAYRAGNMNPGAVTLVFPCNPKGFGGNPGGRLTACLHQRDGVDVAAIVGFGAMGRAAEAEEARRLAIGA
jgi:hypothetical protein